jgi:hypothetical protein
MHKIIFTMLAFLFACGVSKAQFAPLVLPAQYGPRGLAGPAAADPQFPATGQGAYGGQGLAPFGNGEQPLPRFAGESGPQNVLMFNLNDSTGYENHVYATNQGTYGDFFTDAGAELAFFAERKHLSFSMDYLPSFYVYRRDTGADNWNQSLNLSAAFELSQRFELRVRDYGLEYSYGMFGNGQQLVPGLEPPGGVVSNSINPSSRYINDNSRLDLVFTKSERTMIDVFGGYNIMTFRGTSTEMQGATGGLSFMYLPSRRGALSATYTYSNSLFEANSSLLNAGTTPMGSRFATQSLNLSYAYRIFKSTSVSLFAGPERTHVRETLVELIPLPPFGVGQLIIPVDQFEWAWSAGGGVMTTTHNTTLSLMASRAVTNGGGLLTDVTGTFGALAIGRRLPHGWQWSTTLNYGLSQALALGGLQRGSFNTETGMASLSHKLGERLTYSMDYQYQRQRVGGGTSINVASLDRSVATIRFGWQVKRVAIRSH